MMVLKGLLFSAFLQTTGLVVSATPVPETAPQSVASISSLDVSRYAGIWYEVSHTTQVETQDFDSQCVRDKSFVLTQKAAGELAILDQCIDHQGFVQRRDGVAQLADAAKGFQVSYQMAPLRMLPSAWSEYRIVYLDDEYNIAAVTDERGSNLRILSRTPQPNLDDYRTVLDQLSQKGFPTRRLLTSLQTGQHV